MRETLDNLMRPLRGTTILCSAVVGATFSGIPSTVHALATGANPLDAVRAAGTIAVGEAAPPATRAMAGIAVHATVSLGWTVVLAAVLPRRHAIVWSALAGLGIAALDLGIAQRRFPAIAALPRAPQVADHVAFGAIVGAALGRAGGARRSPFANRDVRRASRS